MKKISIVVPVYNEEKILEQNILKILDFCQKNLYSHDYQIIIADNNSSDKTGQISQILEKKYLNIKYTYTNNKGKGLAIRTAWNKYPASINCFMDADLATDLSYLKNLIEPIILQKANITIGSRYLTASKIDRSQLRTLLSKINTIIINWVFGLKINDYPCGFKAFDYEIIKNILPNVKNDSWFFDSELLIRSIKLNYKIQEISVEWSDNADKKIRHSRVNLLKTILQYLKETIRLKIQIQ
ncbi:MAG: glycosyltransferase [Patescibacteria group bacterium]|jgi:glycosyltransferase involved in cell wall biosynthesis|nr:glycosyltransferase [Patescibacteria group bacterium]